MFLQRVLVAVKELLQFGKHCRLADRVRNSSLDCFSFIFIEHMNGVTQMKKTENYYNCSLLKKQIRLDDIFTKEDISDEHKMILDSTVNFVEKDVLPILPNIEQQEFDKLKDMIKKSGELGLLGIDIPETYGGIELDKISSIIITEQMARARSFSITYSGQVGIGSLPIVYYGTDNQKRKYLPSVATGNKIGAYALTEPNAGTDALGIQTSATLSNNGKHYIINGEKQFITNASIADFFILYAKIAGEKFTAFIMDKDIEGLTIGTEEEKMGLKGSSTTSLVLNNVKVPVENVLGEIGKGHLIAFNILNMGRLKLAATCLGTAKHALQLAIQYVTERKQFKRLLSEFNLTKEKIATMAATIYAMESMIYRTAGELEKAAAFAKDMNRPFVEILKSYAAECSVNKVFASEVLDAVVDESLQLHGGYGFISDYEIETLYRDSRINRIFEGTNEINRMVVANFILQNLDKFLENRQIIEKRSEPFDCQWNLLHELRRFTASFARNLKETYSNLAEEQERLVRLSDFVTLTYALESSLIRLEKTLQNNFTKDVEQKTRLVQVFTEEAAAQFITKAMSITLDRNVNEKLAELTSYFHQRRIDVTEMKREIANQMFETN